MYDITCAPFFALATRPIHCNLRCEGLFNSPCHVELLVSHCRPYTASFQGLFACALFNVTFRSNREFRVALNCDL